MTYLMDTYVNLPNFRSRESALTYALSNELLLSSSDYIDSTSFFFSFNRSSEPTGTGATFKPGTWQPPTWMPTWISADGGAIPEHFSFTYLCNTLTFALELEEKGTWISSSAAQASVGVVDYQDAMLPLYFCRFLLCNLVGRCSNYNEL